MASKNQEYAAQYAECAMAQMRRYGIPASVILAQGILESSNGRAVWHWPRTTISVSRPPPNGLHKAGGTGYIPTTNRTRNSAATRAWANPTSTTPAS